MVKKPFGDTFKKLIMKDEVTDKKAVTDSEIKQRSVIYG